MLSSGVPFKWCGMRSLWQTCCSSKAPGKLKKLGQILGPDWIIKASMGHIRELANDGVDALGFDLATDTITCRYQPRDARSKKVLAELRQAVKKSPAGLHCHRPRPGRGNHWLAPAAGSQPEATPAGGLQRNYAPGGQGCHCPPPHSRPEFSRCRLRPRLPR